MKRIFIDLDVPCPECRNQPNYEGDVKAQVLMVEAKINVLGKDNVKYALLCRRCAKALGMNGEKEAGAEVGISAESNDAPRTPSKVQELSLDD